MLLSDKVGLKKRIITKDKNKAQQNSENLKSDSLFSDYNAVKLEIIKISRKTPPNTWKLNNTNLNNPSVKI